MSRTTRSIQLWDVGQGQDIPLAALHPRRHPCRIAVDRLMDATHNDHNAGSQPLGCPDMRHFIVPVNGMNRLQERRRDQITPRTMVSALLWELCQLHSTSIANVVNLNGWRCFEEPAGAFTAALNNLRRKAADGVTFVRYLYPFNKGLRQAEYVFWPYQFRYANQAGGQTNGRGSYCRWVLILIRIESIEFASDEWDRIATDIVVIDPVADNRGPRRNAITGRIRRILSEGHIRTQHDALTSRTISFQDLPVRQEYASGHVCFAIARELFRRIRVILRKGTRGRDVPEFWDDFDEDHNHDYTRKCMMTACAHRAIEKSKYFGRLAIEVPGLKFTGKVPTVKDPGPINYDPKLVRPSGPSPPGAYKPDWDNELDPMHSSAFDDDQRENRRWRVVEGEADRTAADCPDPDYTRLQNARSAE
ncbi:hypothetical protein BJ170DRAFT_592488 [Xylariales sp. AK1849]|nr:hypothetical protein BJ170DRAFT_592488 [Xylariales sp. AK1849]